MWGGREVGVTDCATDKGNIGQLFIAAKILKRTTRTRKNMWVDTCG